jgi:hypothetical protein
MGLPSYIINFDELKQPIIDAINEAAISVTLGDITLDSTAISIDTSAIETILDEMFVKLETTDNNMKLVSDTSKQILTSIKAHDVSINTHLTTITTKVEDIVTSMVDMHGLLEKIKEALASEGTQRIVGESLAVPSIAGSYTKTWNLTKDILITGFTISQSAWNFNDKWSLSIGGSFMMFDKIHTKMRGEHKQLSKFLPVPAGTDITLTYDNTSSSNSKYVWADLEFLELEPVTGTPTT